MANQPELSALLSRYLERQTQAHEQGLGSPTSLGEVVPHEAGPVQAIDPRLAWGEAVASVALFLPEEAITSWKAPSCWPTLVGALEPTVALAFCAGNFPQLVRDLHPLLQTRDLSQLRPDSARPLAAPGLTEWATEAAKKRQFPQLLLALGVLRMSRQFDKADALLQMPEAEIPVKWRPLWANEQAALAWHQGKSSAARDLWNRQAASVPVLFNRGMAALFLGDAAEARTNLAQAVAQLSEDGAWYHLGRLYLALAETSV